MPTFDIVSEVDMQEVRNAVDQANREAATRFDFKNTDSAIELSESELVLRSSTEDRLRALHQVLDEKLVKRQVSLKAFEDAKVEEAQKGTSRQKIAIQAGISSDHAKKINKFIKELGLKGVSSQTQGDQLRVNGKKRDDLQAVIAACKAEDFGIPLQFNNFRDGPPDRPPAGTACPIARPGPGGWEAQTASTRSASSSTGCKWNSRLYSMYLSTQN